MPFQPQNQIPVNLFKAIGPQNLNLNQSNYLKKGGLITFSYLRWKHDSTPLLLITSISEKYIKGINLHYLTFPYISNLLRIGCNNPFFTYQNIKNDVFLKSAFRGYIYNQIRTVKVLDSKFILTVMQSVRSFDPTQVQKIRRAVQDQIRTANTMQPSASDLTGS